MNISYIKSPPRKFLKFLYFFFLPMNSVQTVTINNALSQNWLVCIVCTPRNQVARTLRAQCPRRGRCCAHTARTVPTSWALLRAQQACHTHVPCAASVGRAQATQVARRQRRSRTCWACTGCDTLRRPASCRDLKPWSRHQITTRQPEPCRDIKSV